MEYANEFLRTIGAIDWNLNLVLQLLATISGILCVYLQTREKILAWPFGIISVTISAYERMCDPNNVFVSVSEAPAWRILNWLVDDPGALRGRMTTEP